MNNNRAEIKLTYITFAAPLVLASIKSMQNSKRLNQNARLLLQNNWKIIGLAEVPAHDVRNKVPHCFARSIRGS